MSSAKDLMVGEKPLASLRVIDLKEELEKRGLPKSGSKKDLADRLKNVSTSESLPRLSWPPFLSISIQGILSHACFILLHSTGFRGCATRRTSRTLGSRQTNVERQRETV
jgi:hypothetical protein